MVGEVTLSITRSWVQNLSLPDERSNRETSRRIGFYSVYLVSLQGLPFILLIFLAIKVDVKVVKIDQEPKWLALSVIFTNLYKLQTYITSSRSN